jgi:hypothetical protein
LVVCKYKKKYLILAPPLNQSLIIMVWHHIAYSLQKYFTRDVILFIKRIFTHTQKKIGSIFFQT